MTTSLKFCMIVGPLLSAVALSGSVWQSDYDALQAKNQELQQQVATQSCEIDASKAQASGRAKNRRVELTLAGSSS